MASLFLAVVKADLLPIGFGYLKVYLVDITQGLGFNYLLGWTISNYFTLLHGDDGV